MTDRRVALLSSLVLLVGGGLALRSLVIDLWPLFLPLLFFPLALWFAFSSRRSTFLLRTVASGLAVTFILGLSLTVHMVKRVQSPDQIGFVHDGAVQTEDAMHFLRQGVNPYTADYRQSPFGNFIDTFSRGARPNPAWTHHIYLPFHLLGSLPFQWSFEQVTGWYDQRIVYILAEGVAIFFLVRLASRWGREWQLSIALIFALNPFWTKLFINGFNDIFVFFFMAGCFWALARGRPLAAGIWFGLALASKQSAWLFIPFFAVLLWSQRQYLKHWWQGVVGAAAVTAVIVAPFILWSPKNFILDTIHYPAGTLATSYPVSGSGFSMYLLDKGIIHSMWDYYPFFWWQLALAGPVLVAALLLVRRWPRLEVAIVGSTLFAAVFWYFSRFFNINYITYLTFFLIAALAWWGPRYRLSDARS